MVGVPKSTGCLLCVKRRVKCDEGQPTCANCAKYGNPCPGYDRSLKFIAGKHQIRRRRPQASGAAGPDPGSGPSAPASSSAPLSGGALVILSSPSAATATVSTGPSSRPNQQRQQQQTAQQTYFPLTQQPRDSWRPFICQAIESLRGSSMAEDWFIFTPWFARVPPYLGNQATLDIAMAAFTVHLLGKARRDGALVARSRALYGQALGALQRSLNHPVEWRTSEVLCATMVLGIFELFAGTIDTDSWMRHAVGVSWLMQQRGPEAHKNPFDRAMLLSFRPIIIMHAMFSAQDCFLAKKAWQDVVRDASQNRELTQTEQIQALMDQYLEYLARVPALLHRGWALREARRHGMPVDAAVVPPLTRRGERLRTDYLAWFARFQQLAPGPAEVPSQDPGSIYASVLEYASPWLGSAYMGYWASMLIVQEVLRQCRYAAIAAEDAQGAGGSSDSEADAFAETNRRHALDILRSVETVGRGYMGPYRVGYSVRIAYEFADVRAQTWVMALLSRMEKHYAATSTQGYPKPGATSIWAE